MVATPSQFPPPTSLGEPRSADRDGVPCPACGRRVDPLRAGEVAVVDGQFRYFCDLRCKAAHLEALGVPASRPMAEHAPPSRREGAPPAPRAAAALVVPTPRADSLAPRDDGSASEPPPLMVLAGGVLGLVPAAIALTVPAQHGVALTFATLAQAVLCGYAGLERSRASATSVAYLLPPLLAFVAAVAATMASRPDVAALVAMAGLAATGTLAVRWLTARFLRPLRGELNRLREGLDVSARVLRGSDVEWCPCGELHAGDTVIVGAQQRVPVDGTVAGNADVAPWLDAASTERRHDGDFVVAGARVQSGELRVVAAFVGADRAWAHAFEATTARGRWALTSQRISHLGGAVSAGIGAIWLFVGPGGLAHALAVGAALGLALGGHSVADAIWLVQRRALLRALGRGIAFRTEETLERAGAVDTAVFCTQGTLLASDPEVVVTECVGGFSEQHLLALAAGAEALSTVGAGPIQRAAHARGLAPAVLRPTALSGLPAIAATSTAGERLVLGRRADLLAHKVGVAIVDDRVSQLEALGRSVLLLAVDDRVAGLIGLQFALRPGARAAVQRLLDAHIEPVLLSGDARETCEALAHALDIEHVRADVEHGEEGQTVAALGESGHRVAVLGRAPRDLAALLAGETALVLGAVGGFYGDLPVTLATEDVRDAVQAPLIARAALRRVRTLFVLGVSPALLLLLALSFGVLPPLLGPVLGLVVAVAVLRIATATRAGLD